MKVRLEFEIYPETEDEAMDMLDDIEDWPRMLHGHTTEILVLEQS
jgi:hypothetical protein